MKKNLIALNFLMVQNQNHEGMKKNLIALNFLMVQNQNHEGMKNNEGTP